MMSMFNPCSARPKLGHAVAAKRARMIDAEHPVFVAVKGDRLAPGFEVGASCVEIGKGRLALDKLQVHQPTRRVINEHEQRALRTAILKPPVLAAVDLHQLADAVAPGARLMDALSPLLAIDPQLGLDHPQP
jgi:hypothetical protein